MNINVLDENNVDHIRDMFNLPLLCARVLASKNLDDEEIKQLLQPAKLSNPFEGVGIAQFKVRIDQAKQKNEKVMVCGDYDCGVTRF